MENINVNEVELNGVKYIRKDSVTANQIAEKLDNMPYVMVRSYAAGVHFGYLKSEKFTEAGKVVVLVKTKRVFYWSGAASLSQLSLEGSKKPTECKISVELESNEIVNVIETIPMTESAKKNLNDIKTWKI